MMTTKNNSTAEILKKLKKIIADNTYSDGQGYGFEGEDKVIACVKKALTRQRTALIEQIEREVIGEDDFPLSGEDGTMAMIDEAIKDEKNKLRAEQRLKLDKIRKEGI